MKLHKQIYHEARGMTLNTTLCGRENKNSWNVSDGSNVADSDDQVTCKFCLKMMKQKKVRKEVRFGIKLKPTNDALSEPKTKKEAIGNQSDALNNRIKCKNCGKTKEEHERINHGRKGVQYKCETIYSDKPDEYGRFPIIKASNWDALYNSGERGKE